MHHFDSESQSNDARIKSAVKTAVLVRALRNAFVMSQSYLAELSGTSRPTLNRIESMDKRSTRSDTIDDILQVFRDRGAEITVTDEEINIRFTRNALLYAYQELEMSANERDKKRVT
jgi:transcriptional regulator with XRE-family HTH domain